MNRITCAVCRRQFARPKARGRSPSYCSTTCRRLAEKVRAGLVKAYVGLVAEKRGLELMAKMGDRWTTPFGLPSRGRGKPSDALAEVEIELADVISRLDELDAAASTTTEEQT